MVHHRLFLKAHDFVKILRTALAAEKAVLAMKGTRDLPDSPVYGTIDIWCSDADHGSCFVSGVNETQ